jgi:hypothetical protein
MRTKFDAITAVVNKIKLTTVIHFLRLRKKETAFSGNRTLCMITINTGSTTKNKKTNIIVLFRVNNKFATIVLAQA